MVVGDDPVNLKHLMKFVDTIVPYLAYAHCTNNTDGHRLIAIVIMLFLLLYLLLRYRTNLSEVELPILLAAYQSTEGKKVLKGVG